MLDCIEQKKQLNRNELSNKLYQWKYKTVPFAISNNAQKAFCQVPVFVLDTVFILMFLVDLFQQIGSILSARKEHERSKEQLTVAAYLVFRAKGTSPNTQKN